MRRSVGEVVQHQLALRARVTRDVLEVAVTGPAQVTPTGVSLSAGGGIEAEHTSGRTFEHDLTETVGERFGDTGR